MYGPIIAAFSVFASAVEWIDDPHAGRGEALAVVDGFFGQHGVKGTLCCQRFEQKKVRATITRVAEGAALMGAAAAQLFE